MFVAFCYVSTNPFHGSRTKLCFTLSKFLLLFIHFNVTKSGLKRRLQFQPSYMEQHSKREGRLIQSEESWDISILIQVRTSG